MPHSAGPTPEILEQAAALGLSTDRLPDTIDRDAYTPALLALLNNVMLWGGSRVFHHLHGVGTNEWRILSCLGNHPGATAQEACEILGINKSIASKSVTVLVERGLVASLDGPRGSRHLFLTPEGVKVHDDFMPIARQRQRILHAGLDEGEVRQLQSYLVRMLAASDALEEYERSITSAPSAR